METVLLENCIKQYQILVTSLKERLTSMYKDVLYYDDLYHNEIKRNLFAAIKMISTTEEVMKVYDDKNK